MSMLKFSFNTIYIPIKYTLGVNDRWVYENKIEDITNIYIYDITWNVYTASGTGSDPRFLIPSYSIRTL